MFLGGGMLLATGAWLGYNLWIGYGEIGESRGLQLFFAVMSVGLASTGFACIFSVLRFRLVVDMDRVRVRQYIEYAEIQKKDIRGFRMPPNFTIILIAKDKARTNVTVPLYFKADDTLWEWLDDLPNLDTEDQVAAGEKLLANEALGTNEERRWRHLQEAHRAAKYINYFSILVACWALFYPRPYELVVCLVMITPWLAMEVMRRFKGIVRSDGPTNDLYPQIAIALLTPAVLFIRVFFDWQVLGWIKGLGMAVALASAMLGLILMLDPNQRRKFLHVFPTFLFLLPYGYGTVILTNCLWGEQPIESIEVEVTSKRVSSGSRSPTLYLLESSPWGPRTERQEVDVARSLYEDTEAGDLVCVAVRPGALGVAWFTVRRCP